MPNGKRVVEIKFQSEIAQCASQVADEGYMLRSRIRGHWAVEFLLYESEKSVACSVENGTIEL